MEVLFGNMDKVDDMRTSEGRSFATEYVVEKRTDLFKINFTLFGNFSHIAFFTFGFLFVKLMVVKPEEKKIL